MKNGANIPSSEIPASSLKRPISQTYEQHPMNYRQAHSNGHEEEDDDSIQVLEDHEVEILIREKETKDH